MNPEEKCWRAAIRPASLVATIEARLTAQGAVTELRQLQGLSAQEYDRLLEREISADFPIIDIAASTSDARNPQGCAPGGPHASDGTVAA